MRTIFRLKELFRNYVGGPAGTLHQVFECAVGDRGVRSLDGGRERLLTFGGWQQRATGTSTRRLAQTLADMLPDRLPGIGPLPGGRGSVLRRLM